MSRSAGSTFTTTEVPVGSVRPTRGTRRAARAAARPAPAGTAGFPLSAAVDAEIFQDYDRHFGEGSAPVIAGIEARCRA